MKLMKKAGTILLVYVMLLTGCCDMYAGKRPLDYAKTKWISEDPYIMLKVEKADEVPYCEMELNGEVVRVVMAFDYGNGIVVWPYIEGATTHDSQDDLFWGECKFSKTKCVIKNIKDYKDVIDDSVKKITLVRYDYE